jgi:hypothetical protein
MEAIKIKWEALRTAKLALANVDYSLETLDNAITRARQFIADQSTSRRDQLRPSLRNWTGCISSGMASSIRGAKRRKMTATA